MKARDAYIALNLMEGVGPVSVKALIDKLGAPEAIWQANKKDFLEVPGIGHLTAEKILAQREKIDFLSEIEQASQAGIQVITRVDAAYPAWLAKIHDPPLALYVKGDFKPTDQRALAIVGTRHASFYGRETANRLAAQLARAGWVVVSGLARGIDTVAHQAAVTSGGRTIAVLGSGLLNIYPPENKPLAEQIAGGQGALVSEFPLGRPPDRTTFPMRNRIVSGLARGVLVVEAGVRSGALITANQALEQGRSVMAVPGRIDAPGSRGTHFLLKQGARLVEDLEDILEEFEFLIPPKANSDTAAQTSLPEGLSDEESKILIFLRGEEQDFDALIRHTGIVAARMNVLLLSMEMKKLIRVLPGRLVAAVGK